VQRESSRSSDRDVTEQRITVMLIGVVVVFLVCQLPQAIQKLYTVYLVSTTPDGRLTAARRLQLAIGGNFCNLLVIVNSASNFVLYSALSAKFRDTFRRTFCRCRQSLYHDPVTSTSAVPLSKTMVTANSDPPPQTASSHDEHVVTAETSDQTLLDGAV